MSRHGVTIAIGLLLAVVHSLGQSSLETLYRAATEDMTAQRWAEATEKFERILRDDPEHVPSMFNLALALTRLDEHERAIQTYRKLLDRDSTVFEAQINLGILYAETGRTVLAVERFEAASRLKPADAVPVFYGARLVAKQGDVSKAESLFLKAVELAPASGEVLAEAGLFLLELKKDREADALLQRAAAQGVDSAPVWIGLGESALRRSDRPAAIGFLEKASAKDPDNVQLRHQLGVLYRESGMFPKAIEFFKSVPGSKLELALSYFDNRNFQEAAQAFEELLKGDPANADYAYMLGKSWFETKQYDRARSLLEQVVRKHPDYTDAFGTLGSVLYAQENWPAAIPILERFTALRPGEAFPHFVLATCFDRVSDWPNAVVHYNKFLQLDDKANDARTFQARQRSQTLERRLRKR